MELPIRIPGVEPEGELGRGAYAVVFRARHAGLPCAVKVPRWRGKSHRWFRREALALARVKDPGLPGVMEVGEVEGVPYLVMELAEGTSLADRLRRGRLSEGEALGVALQVCRTLAAVHRRGLVHRDIKPGNIIFDAGSGAVRLVDFGFVTQVDRSEPIDPAGTRAYAAPEQLPDPQTLDGRADLFALGGVLFECLTAKRLPRDPKCPDGQRIHALLSAAGVNRSFAQIIVGLPQEELADRYPSSAAALRDLERFEGGLLPLGPDVEAPEAGEPLRLFGREPELERLRQAWRAAQEGRGAVALIQGVPGTGKSHLLHALTQEMGDGLMLAARCEESDPAPLKALKGMFDSYLRTVRAMRAQDQARAEEALRRAGHGQLARLVGLVSGDLAALLGQAPLAEPPRDIHEAFVEGVAEFICRLAAGAGPLLIAIDDLQWVDPVSREVLVRVAHRAPDLPLFCVGTIRSDEAHSKEVRRIAAAFPQGRLTNVQLGPLEVDALGRILAAYLGADSLDSGLVTRVAALSDGTPLSAIGILEAFVDHGVLAPHWGRWRFDAQRAEHMTLPSSALAVLQERIATLAPASRRVLEAASVIGTTFDDPILARVMSIETDALAYATSDARRLGLVEPMARHRHRFVHERVREALIASLTQEARQRLHARIARAMDAHRSTDDERIYELATHYALGAPDIEAARGLTVTLTAAERAFERFDNETALRFFEWARFFSEQGGERLGPSYHRGLGEVRLRVGDLPQSLQAFEEAYRQVTSASDRAEILGRIAWVHQARAEPDAAWSALQRAFAVLNVRMPDEHPKSWARSLTAWAQTRITPRRKSIAKPGSDQERVLRILCDLHYQNARLGIEYGKSLRFLQSTLAVIDVASRLGPSGALAKSSAMYGFALVALGQTRVGLKYLARAQRMAEDVGDTIVFVYCLQLQSVAHYWLGHLREADALVRRCLDEYGHWLEASEFCGNVFNARTVEALRGRPMRELQWAERAIERVARSGRSPTAFKVVEEGAYAALAALGRNEEITALKARLAPLKPSHESAGFNALMLWSVRIRAHTERGDLGTEFERLVQDFRSEGHDPTKAHLVLAEYFVHLAHARVSQCLAATRSDHAHLLCELDRAAKDLGGIARNPLLKAHFNAVEGYRAYLRGDVQRARRFLARAETLAEKENAPWVLYAVARAEAHILRARGFVEAASEKARIAAMLAREHGTVYRLRAVAEEFDLRVSSPPTSLALASEAGLSTRSSRRRQQLRTLLQVVRTSSRELNLEQQARQVLGELVQNFDANRALLVYRGGDEAPMRIEADDGTSPAEASAEDEVIRHVESTGEVFFRGATSHGWGQSGSSGRAHLLAVPLVLKERITGVVYVQRDGAAEPFSPEDRDLLVALSYQVLSALELTRLLEQRERLEQSLRQAQKMEAVGRLAGGIAHDFNNMLTVIEASVEALLERSELQDACGADLTMIEDAAQRAKALTKQLLGFSRRQVVRPEVQDPNDVLRDLAPMLQRLIGENVSVEMDLQHGAYAIKVDRSSFEQAIVNLAVNARDAMPEGGRLCLCTRNVELDEDWSRQRDAPCSGPHVQVTVSDTGQGMTSDVRARIFDPFFTTKQLTGTGLGLSTVYGFVKQSSGYIDVESEVGRGTTFHLYLPRRREEFLRPSTLPPKPIERTATETVLLVEDDGLVRSSIRRILQRAGYQVLTAEGGREALGLVEAHGDDIALVISDVLMPDMSGPQLVERLRASLPRAKFLHISGYTDGHLAAQEGLVGEVPLMQKPFTSSELKNCLRELLGEP